MSISSLGVCVVLCVCVCVCVSKALRAGLDNGRGSEDTCSLIRSDKRGQAEGGKVGRMMGHSLCHCFSLCLASTHS